jgi:MFS family permease
VDRRTLILMTAAASGGASVLGGLFGWNYELLLVAAFFLGGASNPLYALLIAYTNDFLEPADMSAASGRMMFLNGIGAISGPIIMGWFMGIVGPSGFFAFMALMGFVLAAYAAYRMTQRASPSVGETGTYAPVLPSATAVVVEAAQEYFIEESEQSDDSLNHAP